MAKQSNQVRIIGGSWRGRKIKIARNREIRPTPNRVRETLFNWLAQDIFGMVCLDLFAGSGALGFEAISRGAKKVVMVEKSRDVAKVLRANVELLNCDSIEIINASFSSEWTNGFADKFDLVFLDPPFHKNMANPAWKWLSQHGCLSESAFVYIEVESSADIQALSEDWRLYRKHVAGQVGYYLFQRQNAVAGSEQE